MSTKKTIQINPDLFSTNKTRKKKEKIIQSKPFIKTNSVKRALLKRIKHHAKNREKDYENNTIVSSKEEQFSNDFHSHLDYLNTIQKKNKTMKKSQREKQEENTIDANVFLPPELNDVSNDVSNNVSNNVNLSPDHIYSPPYGCLKNGSKPTWRQWKRSTQKVYDEPIPISTNENIIPSIQSNNTPLSFGLNINKMNSNPVASTSIVNKPVANKPIANKNIEITERELKLQSLRRKLKHEELKQQKKKNKIKNATTTTTLKKRTTKVENHYGKQNNKVSVLVKNSTTRKNIQHEHSLLKQTSIEDVKKYLKSHYLLKIGSNAPNDVLRKMYETLHLCGEVKNINSENLVHNYLNDDSEEQM